MTLHPLIDSSRSRKVVRQGSLPVRTVTRETFDSLVVQGHGPIVVEFMSYGCDHCRAVEPLLEEAATRMKEKEQVFRVNVAVEPDLVEQCKIAATPTFVMYLEGQEIDRLEGAPDTVAAVVRALTEPFAFGDEAQP